METKKEIYEKVMHYAHLLEDKLSYDETEEGNRWGKLVNKLQNFNFDKEVEEEKIPFNYYFLRKKLDWEQFCDLTGIDYYAIRNGFEIKDAEIFYLTESQAKKHNLL
jgi:hypothetical protein